MKTRTILIVLFSLVLALTLTATLGRAQGPELEGAGGVPLVPDTAPSADLGTGFIYQGQLQRDGAPYSGNCDLQFSLWDAASDGTQVGTTQEKNNVPVSNGYFTIPDLDYGSNAFTGQARWLQIAVRCPAGSGMYTNLSPRQALAATPYALGLRPGAFVQGSVGLGGVVSADNTSTGLLGCGLWGTSAGYIGVYGKSTATSNPTTGVWGESASPEGRGVAGYATATSGTTYGVYGESDSSGGVGVYATAPWRGVVGYATATSGANIGVYGESASTDGSGVYGRATAASGNAAGVVGYSSSAVGAGVLGWSDGSSGVGIYGVSSATGYAGYFLGNVHVIGNLSATGSKSFKIDHPLDPANRYLYHFAQEGPEVQNVYNGVATLDARGEANVTLPAYFSALNTGPFRYQLTAIGAAMPNLHIAQEIEGNAFRIAGGVPGKKVSWEVTAVRNDPYLRDHPAQAEVDKPAGEQGTYLYPAGYGRPPEMGLDYQRNQRLLERPEVAPGPGEDGE